MYTAINTLVPKRSFTYVLNSANTGPENVDISSIFTGDVVEGAVWLVTGENKSADLILKC